jgi:hypothetical protein
MAALSGNIVTVIFSLYPVEGERIVFNPKGLASHPWASPAAWSADCCALKRCGVKGLLHQPVRSS